MALAGFGVQLAKGTGVSAVPIAEVRDVSGPGLSRGSIDTTHHASPGRWSQFIKGIKDGGEITLDINYLPADTTHSAASTGLLGDLAEDTVISTWSLIFPDTDETTWTFPAFITSFEPASPLDDRLSASVTFKIAGQPTLA